MSSAEHRESAITRFIEAIRLEKQVDALYYRHFNIQGTACLIPHGYSILRPLRWFRWPIRVLAVPVLILWCAVLQPVSAFLLACRWSLTLRKRTRLRLPPNVYVNASNPRNLGFVAPEDDHYPDTVLHLPFRKCVDTVPHSHRRSDLRDITTVSMLFTAAWYSSLAGWQVLFRKEQRELGLYGYMAFTWLWVYLALEEQMLQTVWLSNHYDRWVKLGTALNGVAVVLVQHGALYHPVSDGVPLTFSTDAKLRNITRVYVVDGESIPLFHLYIDCAKVDFVRLQLRTELQPWRDAGNKRYKILIVGNQGELGMHARLIRQLMLDVHAEHMDVAYRYHPMQRKRLGSIERSAKGGAGLWELTAREPIPVPDLVVSYGSSLDGEIEAHSGADIIRYSWTVDINVDDLVQKIVARVTAGCR